MSMLCIMMASIEKEKQADQVVFATPSSGLPSLALRGRFDVFTLSITARGEKRVRGEVEMRGGEGEERKGGWKSGTGLCARGRNGKIASEGTPN